MERRYIDILVDLMKEGHKETMNYSLDASERFDKIVVWIIGLSTGSIALLVSASEKIAFASSKTLKVTVLFLVMAIIFGIISRMSSFISYQMGVGLFSNYYSRLSMLTFPHEPRQLNGDETADMIYRFMIEDFRIDMQSILEYKKYPKEQWPILHESARNFYLDYEKWSENQIESDLKKVTSTIESSLGYVDGYIMKKANSPTNTGRSMRRLASLGVVFNIVSILFFGTAVVYFTWFFVK